MHVSHGIGMLDQMAAMRVPICEDIDDLKLFIGSIGHAVQVKPKSRRIISVGAAC